MFKLSQRLGKDSSPVKAGIYLNFHVAILNVVFETVPFQRNMLGAHRSSFGVS
jgi:hypothetical protein